MSKSKASLGLVAALGLAAGSLGLAQAQGSELRLSVQRLFGYGGGDQIEGSFRMELVEPPALTSATFYIDSEEVGAVTEPPFRVDFETGDYEHGWHDLWAAGRTPSGAILKSDVRRFEFVSAETGWQAAQSILIRVGGGVLILIAVIFALQILPTFRGKRKTLPLGAPRNYGLKGGTICPQCHRPYAIHVLSFNLGLSYFDYCEHCGKWSVVRALPRRQLAAAEQAELELARPDAPIAAESADERLRRQLEESRFTDDR